MFRPLRSNEKTHGQLLRAELGESMDHAMRAAGYAAGGVKAAVGPRLDRFRSEEEKVSSRWPKLAGLLAAGALTGAVAAFVLRRRRQQQWEEYDPMQAVQGEREPAPAPESAEQAAEQPS
jgi:hypothetical protein